MYKNSDKKVYVKHNFEVVWKIIFNACNLQPIHLEILFKNYQDNSKYKEAVNIFTWLYSLECFLYKSLNETIRSKDITKIDSLGPFALCLNKCLNNIKKLTSQNDLLEKLKYVDKEKGIAIVWRGCPVDYNLLNH